MTSQYHSRSILATSSLLTAVLAVAGSGVMASSSNAAPPFEVLEARAGVLGNIGLQWGQWFSADYNFTLAQGDWHGNSFTGFSRWGTLEYVGWNQDDRRSYSYDYAEVDPIESDLGIHAGTFSESYAKQLAAYPTEYALGNSYSNSTTYFEVTEPVCYVADLYGSMGGNNGGQRNWSRSLEMVEWDPDALPDHGGAWVPVRTYFNDRHRAIDGGTDWANSYGQRYDRTQYGKLIPGIYRLTVVSDSRSAPYDHAAIEENWASAAAYLEMTPAPLSDLNGDGIVNGFDLTVLLNAWGSDDSMVDLNCDGIIDGGDLTILLSDWS